MNFRFISVVLVLFLSCHNTRNLKADVFFGNWITSDKSFIITLSKDSIFINNTPPLIANYYWIKDTLFLEGTLSKMILFKSKLEYDSLSKKLMLNREDGGKNLILVRP